MYCAICLDKCQNEKSITTCCKHEFHKSCIEQWVKHTQLNECATCPVCRADIGLCNYLTVEEQVEWINKQIEMNQSLWKEMVNDFVECRELLVGYELLDELTQ